MSHLLKMLCWEKLIIQVCYWDIYKKKSLNERNRKRRSRAIKVGMYYHGYCKMCLNFCQVYWVGWDHVTTRIVGWEALCVTTCFDSGINHKAMGVTGDGRSATGQDESLINTDDGITNGHGEVVNWDERRICANILCQIMSSQLEMGGVLLGRDWASARDCKITLQNIWSDLWVSIKADFGNACNM